MFALLAEGGGHHHPPHSIFTWLFMKLEGTGLDEFYGFHANYDPAQGEFLGLFWFDAICFTIIGSATLILFASIATRDYKRVPRGIQNIFESAVQLLRNLVHSIIPAPQGDKYVPYLGTLFLFIFSMNLMGLVPGFRAPTMTLSTTAALGITTFIMVQSYAIRETGVLSYLKHFCGPVMFIAPLMFAVEVVGELAKPMSLSLRLYGNIYGEDNVIEQLMGLGGGWIPVQLPMLLFAIFTSFLQAFIFTTLATIYVASKVVHDEEHGEENGDHGEPAKETTH